MKRLLTLITAAACALCACARFEAGVRDNRHVYASYTLRSHYVFKIEQSVYAEKFGYQYIRAYAGYKGAAASLSYSGQAYFGTAYNGSYRSFGALAGARYGFLKRLSVDARINPHYDSGYGYKTCFSAGAGVGITKAIDFVAAYTTIPEYRMSEKRVQAGFDVRVGGLCVSPRLSIAAEGASKAKTLRALMSFSYVFD